MATWFTLSTSYDIGTVRSVLAFLLSFVSAAGIWVVSYAYWKAGATRALQSTSGTELLSLFSMATVGDALEALGVIRRDMSRSLLFRLALQAVAVVALAMLGVLVLWNKTVERLRATEFPLDRLPDFLPDNDAEWLFREEEWRNVTWSASCAWTPLTPVYDVVATGDYSTGSIFDEVPALRSVVVPHPALLQQPYFHSISTMPPP